MADDKNKGLYQKYYAERVDGKPFKGNQCVVLEFGDPNNWPALRTYADTVEKAGYQSLANDVRSMVDTQERIYYLNE